MKNWIDYPTNFYGSSVDLLSLEEKHFNELEKLAQDEKFGNITLLMGLTLQG
jgi:hypothetical protein